MRFPLGYFFLFLLGFFITTSGFSVGVDPVSPNWEQQRRDFRSAREARERGDVATYQRLRDGLRNYPLYGYLILDDLADRFEGASDQEIETFLARYGELAGATLLRGRWLKRLGEQQHWSTLLAAWREGDGGEARCFRVEARLAQAGEGSLAVDLERELRALWQEDKPNPACEGAFDRWEARGGISTEERWQRIERLLESGNVGTAESLATPLPSPERALVKLWARIHNNPREGLREATNGVDSPRLRALLCYGIKRLGREDLTEAWQQWQSLKIRYSFTPAQRADTERTLALRAARDNHPQALAWLMGLTRSDGEVRRARVRIALGAGDWDEVLRQIQALQPWERGADRWRYWEARAQEQTGHSELARPLYQELAGHRGYHGFLAADHLGQSYAFNHRPLAGDDARLAALEQRPALIRARELFLTSYPADGRREWIAGIAGCGEADLLAAARLASRLSWSDRVITTLGRTTEEDDLTLRFPLDYRNQLTARATEAGLPAAVVYGIVRQESIFMADAKSSVGALGLMQLMPQTGAQVAKSLKIALKGSGELLQPDRNLQLGSKYLSQQMNRYGGSLALAAAAYNAGPGRVKQWRPDTAQAADVWVELIPFDETRRYARNVLTNTAIYGWRLGQPLVRLSQYMPMVTPE